MRKERMRKVKVRGHSMALKNFCLEYGQPRLKPISATSQL